MFPWPHSFAMMTRETSGKLEFVVEFLGASRTECSARRTVTQFWGVSINSSI